ncbi:MAG: hypothetical protein HY360_24240 [Verrucomicrobia bacterium]|nr:hypothetical protein [Verrucomicrobiota bacterium]
MSLKAFHLIFISAAILLAFGFGAWCLAAWPSGGMPARVSMAVLSFGAAIGLLFYGKWFLKKLNHPELM